MFMGEAFNVGHPEECREEISHWAGKTRVLRLRVERMTGKESGALMRERRAADPSRGEGVAEGQRAYTGGRRAGRGPVT